MSVVTMTSQDENVFKVPAVRPDCVGICSGASNLFCHQSRSIVLTASAT